MTNDPFAGLGIPAPTLPPPPDLSNVMDDIRDAFRVLSTAAGRAAREIAKSIQPAADSRLAELLGLELLPYGGIPVHYASVMPDGEMFFLGETEWSQPCILLGTYRDPERLFGAPGERDVADEARLIVRRGMADVLDWLGEDPEWIGTSEQVLDLMRSGTRAVIPTDPPDPAT